MMKIPLVVIGKPKAARRQVAGASRQKILNQRPMLRHVGAVANVCLWVEALHHAKTLFA